ncbi:RNA polymerase sigma factor, partial [Parabacteroides distasonis]|uniref:RNA polymerase sigma factor n=1 Tax=Parabacteroides distasonis TaxID=823 RepID=UPI001E2CBE26
MIQNHETLSPTVNVKGYLLKTLRHKLYDTIEKNRKMEDISLYEDTFQTDELFSRISLDTTEADERVKLLMKALTKLSPHQREIIYLYYVNGLGHDEIAEILGINYQSSKNLGNYILLYTITKIIKGYRGRKINCVMLYFPFKLIGRGSASAKGVHQ